MNYDILRDAISRPAMHFAVKGKRSLSSRWQCQLIARSSGVQASTTISSTMRFSRARFSFGLRIDGRREQAEGICRSRAGKFLMADCKVKARSRALHARFNAVRFGSGIGSGDEEAERTADGKAHFQQAADRIELHQASPCAEAAKP